MAGSASAVQTNQFLGPQASAFNGLNIATGLNYTNTFNIFLASGPTRNVDVEYIDASGNLASSTLAITTTTSTANLTNAINVNRINWSPTAGNDNNDINVTVRDTFHVVTRNMLSRTFSGAGIITVPNGYAGVVSQLFYYAAVGDDLTMIIKDKYNNTKTARLMPQPISAAAKYTNVGDLNEPLIAGDSVYFLSGQSGSGQKYLHAIVTLTAV